MPAEILWTVTEVVFLKHVGITDSLRERLKISVKDFTFWVEVHDHGHHQDHAWVSWIWFDHFRKWNGLCLQVLQSVCSFTARKWKPQSEQRRNSAHHVTASANYSSKRSSKIISQNCSKVFPFNFLRQFSLCHTAALLFHLSREHMTLIKNMNKDEKCNLAYSLVATVLLALSSNTIDLWDFRAMCWCRTDTVNRVWGKGNMQEWNIVTYSIVTCT